MKKRFLALALSLCLLACSATTAFAANETNLSSQVSYAKEEPETCSYSLYINSAIAIEQNGHNFTGSLNIKANSVDIPSTKKVVVTLDGSNTFTDSGNFYLYKDKGGENEARIRCNISANKNNLYGNEEIVSFENGANSSSPAGSVSFSIGEYDVAQAPVGYYSGTVCFSVAVVDK